MARVPELVEALEPVALEELGPEGGRGEILARGRPGQVGSRERRGEQGRCENGPAGQRESGASTTPGYPFAYSTRICLPSSLVPSRRSSASFGLLVGELDEREPLEDADRADLVLRDHGALGQRPAQRLLADPAALAAVDEQLHVAVAGLGRGARLGALAAGRSRVVVAAARPRRVLDPLLGRLPLADHGLHLALDPAGSRRAASAVTKVIARPVRPTRPVRPIRCT